MKELKTKAGIAAVKNKAKNERRVAFSVPKSKKRKDSPGPGTWQLEGISRIADSTKNCEPVVDHPYFRVRDEERWAGVGCRDIDPEKMKLIMADMKRRERNKKERKGLAGIAKATASTDNRKSKGMSSYEKYCYEKDWEGMDSFEHGLVGPGYFKRIGEREKKFKAKGRKDAKTRNGGRIYR